MVPGEAQQAGPSSDAASVAAAAAPVEQARDVAVTSQSSMAESDEGSDEQAQVRRRRLQRFEQVAGQQQ